MKTLALAFSASKEGNCSKLAGYSLARFAGQGWQPELLKACHLAIQSLRLRVLFCAKLCPVEDGVPMIYERCRNADAVIFAVPDYGGHLASLFFAFSERAQYESRKFTDFEGEFLSKINLIVVANLSAGGDMALHEALYSFANLDFRPEILLFPGSTGKAHSRGILLKTSTLPGAWTGSLIR
ncbi:NAD(P)H-dependent oxidoreductase [candidate division WOR-3 bacterium]|nr:NAD(P)H-dependent oxidoreductase [candidate division WOR-3 bacterium]